MGPMDDKRCRAAQQACAGPTPAGVETAQDATPANPGKKLARPATPKCRPQSPTKTKLSAPGAVQKNTRATLICSNEAINTTGNCSASACV